MRKEIDERMPNPLETEQPEKYRLAWLKYQIFGNNEYSFAKRSMPVLKDKITSKDLSKLLRALNWGGYTRTDSISNILNLITKRFDLIENDDDALRYTANLMLSEINSIFERGSSEQFKNRYWHILNESFEKLEPSRFFANFALLISIILKMATYDFMYSSQYQSFLMKILKKAEHIKNKNIAADLL